MAAMLYPVAHADLEEVVGGALPTCLVSSASKVGKAAAWGLGFVPATHFVNQGLTYLDEKHWFLPKQPS
jgi:hypothetical protein